MSGDSSIEPVRTASLVYGGWWHLGVHAQHNVSFFLRDIQCDACFKQYLNV